MSLIRIDFVAIDPDGNVVHVWEGPDPYMEWHAEDGWHAKMHLQFPPVQVPVEVALIGVRVNGEAHVVSRFGDSENPYWVTIIPPEPGELPLTYTFEQEIVIS